MKRMIVSLVCMWLSSCIFAHDPDVSAIALILDEPVTLEVYAHTAYFDGNYIEVLQENLQHLKLDGQPVPFDVSTLEIDEETSWLFWYTELAEPPEEVTVASRFFPEISSSYTVVTIVEDDDIIAQQILTSDKDSFYFSDVPLWRVRMNTVLDFFWQGIKHIFIGWDHILFLLALLLLGGSLRQLLLVISAFSVAHALTFWLAATGVLVLPANIVEPIIALSVAVAALANLRPEASARDARPAIAFIFGLVHGFGFAGLLGDLGFQGHNLLLSLLAFALGLEVAQVLIAVVTAPILAYIGTRWQTVRQRIMVVGSLLISVVGLWWLLERVFL